MEKIFYTSIAGINFDNRINDSDVGQILGFVQLDKNNQYDSKAIGIYKINGDNIGFIPKADQEGFYDFFKTIEENTQYAFFGNIKKIKSINNNGKTNYYYVGNIGIINSHDPDELTKIINENMFVDFDLYGKSKIL